jgi:predicted anti-sigma-YlaC factor YlaD
MKQISDEMLNNYLDGDLDNNEKKEIEELLKNSERDRTRFQSLMLVHRELSNINEYNVSPNFTSLIMAKLSNMAKYRKSDRNFILSIISVFIVPCFAIIVYMSLNIFKSNIGRTQNPGINEYITFTQHILGYLKIFFTSQNIFITGSILSVVMLITAYFMYEGHRSLKQKFH